MYSLSPYYERLRCRVLQFFGVEDRARCAMSYASQSAEQAQANAFFQNLIVDPFAPLEYQTPVKDRNGRLTGQSVLKRTTVGALMSLDPGYAASRLRLQTLMDGAIRDGIITLTRPDDATRASMLRGPTFVTAQTRDPLFVDPASGILTYPTKYGDRQLRDPAQPNDPRLVPGWFPQPRAVRAVYYTPSVLDRALTPNERLRTLYEQVILAIHAYLKDRNAPLYCHPMVVVCQGPFYVDRDTYTNLDEGVRQYIDQWQHDNGDGRFLIRNSILGMRIPGADPTMVNLFPPYHPQWLESLNRRSPLTTHTGTTQTHGSLFDDSTERTAWNLWTADATLELLRWLNFAQQLLDSGDIAVNEAKQQDARASMVHMFACQALYTKVQDIAYRHVGLERGQNVIGYQEKLAAEAAARRASARNNFIRAVAPGYNSVGDDTADITCAAVNTVGLAFQDAVSAGSPAVGVTSLALRGFAIIMGFINTSQAPRSPYELPMRATDGGPYLYGISPKVALESPPAYRIA